MSPAFAVDCSVALAWLFKDEATAQTDQLLARLDAECVVVPALWFLELSNVIALAERRRRITANQAAVFIDEILKFDIEIDHSAPSRSFTHLLPLCRVQQLTAYDAVYLDLALQRQLPLATLDEPLRKAAKRLGVKVLGS